MTVKVGQEVADGTRQAAVQAMAQAGAAYMDASQGGSPGSPVAKYVQMMVKWELMAYLLGGTNAMRAAGTKYLPQESAEKTEAYNSRLSRSVLFNGFKRAIQNLTGRVFSKPVQVGEDMPSELDYLEEDADRLGNHLNVFARTVFESAVSYGMTHILVDMPPAMPGATLADERTAKHQPYFVHVKATNLIGWRHELQNGEMVLVQARILETADVPQGEFGVMTVERVRVLEPGVWRLYQKDAKNNWVLIDNGTTTLKKVPLITFYTGFQGLMDCNPPLDDLANINVQHWQSSSDQRHILHFARMPLLFGKGLKQAGVTGTVEIGPDNLITGPTDSDLKYVEHTGAAIGAGTEDLKTLEDKMALLGMEPLMPRGTNPTATGRVIDSVENASLLQQWAIGLGDALERAYALAGEWMGLADDTSGSIGVTTDLAFSLRDAQDLQTLLQARLNGEISRATFWAELQRRNVLADTFDADAEKALLESEGPPIPPGTPPLEPPPAKKAPGSNLGGAA